MITSNSYLCIKALLLLDKLFGPNDYKPRLKMCLLDQRCLLQEVRLGHCVYNLYLADPSYLKIQFTRF